MWRPPGIAVAGFLNLFILLGPDGTVSSNGTATMRRMQARYVVKTIRAPHSKRAQTLEVRLQASSWASNSPIPGRARCGPLLVRQPARRVRGAGRGNGPSERMAPRLGPTPFLKCSIVDRPVALVFEHPDHRKRGVIPVTAASKTPAFPTARPAGRPFDPPKEYGALRETAPTSQVRCPAGLDAWLVTRYSDVRAVLADRSMSSRGASSVHVNTHADLDAHIPPGLIIQLDGADHARLRKMVVAEFTVRRVEAMRDYIKGLVESHIEAMLAKSAQVDLVENFALPIPSLVLCELLGVPYSDRERFQQHSTTLVTAGRTREQQQNALDDLFGYLAGLFADKQQNPQKDLFSRLISRSAATGDPLSMEELVVLGVNLLAAGHETTANMIAMSSLVLMEHPSGRDVVLSAPERAVEELLRYLSVVQFGVLRYATKDVQVGARAVKAGEWLVAALNSANRDEEVFPDGDKLDFRRESPRTHVAFGFGAHQCIGQQLARVELQEALTGLFRRVPNLRLAIPRESLAWIRRRVGSGERVEIGEVPSELG